MSGNSVLHFTIDGFMLKFACVADAKLESAGAAVVFVVRNRDAIVRLPFSKPGSILRPLSSLCPATIAPSQPLGLPF